MYRSGSNNFRLSRLGFAFRAGRPDPDVRNFHVLLNPYQASLRFGFADADGVGYCFERYSSEQKQARNRSAQAAEVTPCCQKHPEVPFRAACVDSSLCCPGHFVLRGALFRLA